MYICNHVQQWFRAFTFAGGDRGAVAAPRSWEAANKLSEEGLKGLEIIGCHSHNEHNFEI